MTTKTDPTTVFFGKMAANLTHEIKNILAIIQESAGLMEDIMAISPLAEEKFQEKFNNSLASIKTQLHRGMELSSQFNRFAHLPDHDRTEANLGETIEQFCTLSARFARLKKVGLTAAIPENSRIHLKTNPIQLFMALFLAMEASLDGLPAHSTIEMAPDLKNDRPAVKIACTGPENSNPERFCDAVSKSPAWDQLESTLSQMDARTDCNEDAGCVWILF